MSTSSVPRPVPTAVPRAAAAPRADPHVPALDGVRGVAILLVLLVHLARGDGAAGVAMPVLWMARGGWMGVDVFFVLSGYLITGILLETRAAPGYFRSFYLRRALRIWPLYLLVVAGLATVAATWPALAPRHAAAFPPLAGWIWTQTLNLRLAWGDAPAVPYGTGVYWSLGVEEQFYLVWPVVVALVAPRRLAGVCLALAVGSVALRLALSAAGAELVALFVLPLTHLEPLALGGALAAAVRRPAWAAWLRRQLAGIAAAPWRLAVPAAAALAASPVPHSARLPWWADLAAIPLASVLAAVAIAAVVTHPGATLARRLSAPWLRWVGRVSYGLYVLHVPALVFVPLLWPGLPGALFAPGVLALTFGAAWASWRWWEAPWLSLKRYVPRPAPARSAHDVRQR